MGKYILAIIAIVVVLVGIMAFMQKSGAPAGTENTTPGTSSQGPAPTGNVDDVTAAVLQDAQNDAVPAAETDSTLTQDDTSSLSDVGQSLNATQF